MNSNFYDTFRSLVEKQLRVSKDSGFTLVELLAAILISAIVVMAAGFGLTAMLNVNQEAEAETQRRVEINRATDYISEDVRMASRVESLSGASLPSGATGLFMLTLPDDPETATVNDQVNIVYFLKASSSTWLPDYTIYRAKNDYSGGVSISSVSDTGVNELVDAIANPATDPTCASGTLTGDNGFFSCISADNRTVELFLYGNLPDTTDTYQATSKVFARSN